MARKSATRSRKTTTRGRKTTKRPSRARTKKVTYFDRGDVPDRISRYLDAANLVPPELRGTDKFLDIVSWNIRWFDHKDARRVTDIRKVLGQINADILVLVEIAEDGALDEVVTGLVNARVGYYSTHYGTTGGQQRVVLMWDRDWVRSKTAPVELFPDVPKVIAENGRKKEIFPRRPLWGYFEAKADRPGEQGFTFELLGVHLKSQMAPRGYAGRGGIPQRKEAAARLAGWLDTPEEHFDEDVLIVGDFNAEPNTEEWEAFRALEHASKVDFENINRTGKPGDKVTHIARLNKSGFGGSRLDFQIITNTGEAQELAKEKAAVIRWSFEEQLRHLSTSERNALKKAITTNFSDHLPVVSRFYFTSPEMADEEDRRRPHSGHHR